MLSAVSGEDISSSDSITAVEEITPNLDTFSTRPTDVEKMPSLASAMSLTASQAAASSSLVSPDGSEHSVNDLSG